MDPGCEPWPSIGAPALSPQLHQGLPCSFPFACTNGAGNLSRRSPVQRRDLADHTPSQPPVATGEAHRVQHSVDIGAPTPPASDPMARGFRIFTLHPATATHEQRGQRSRSSPYLPAQRTGDLPHTRASDWMPLSPIGRHLTSRASCFPWSTGAHSTRVTLRVTLIWTMRAMVRLGVGLGRAPRCSR